YYVPVVGWLPTYDVGVNLRQDIIAGITVAFLLVPQGLSYAQALVKIPPVYGLYTCFVPLIVYSLLGTSRQLAVGPEALVCILTGAAITDPADRVAERIATANLIGLMVGLFTSSLGFFRLGFLDSVLSRALLRGFVTAVAVVVGIDMSNTLLGIKLDTGHLRGDETPSNPSPIEHLLHVIEHLDSTHKLTAVISLVSVSFLLSMRMLKYRYKSLRWLQMIPEILLLVASSTFCAFLFRWDLAGVDVLKDVTGGFVSPRLLPARISVRKIKSVLLSSVLITIIGFVESLAVAKTYAGKHNYTVSPNRELVALGSSSIIGSMFGGWPAFGSLGRSAVNDGAGAKTQLAGLVTGCVIGLVILYLLPWFYFLPKAVCSSIIFSAALKLIEVEDFHFIFELRAWGDMGLLLLTFLTTLFISIEAGTLISVGVSLLLVLKHSTKTRISIMGRTVVVDQRTGTVKTKYRAIPTGSTPLQPVQGTLIIRIEEGLFFGNTGQLRERLNRIEMYGELGVHPGEAPLAVRLALDLDRDEGVRNVIFEVEGMAEIDASATQILLEIVKSYRERNVEVYFVKLQSGCRPWFVRSGLTELVGPSHFFRKIAEAIEFVEGTD
ncbi:sulfate transporter family-domain-containing protein, partial [Cladochytrium replicatum]